VPVTERDVWTTFDSRSGHFSFVGARALIVEGSGVPQSGQGAERWTRTSIFGIVDAAVRRHGIILGLLGILFARTALGQGSVDQAREHYRRGTAAYNLGHYAEAAREYEATYEITLDPAALFNTAQAYRLAGENQKAILAYKGYLRAAPVGPQRDLAQQKLDELTKSVAPGAPAAATTTPLPAAPAAAAPVPPSESKAPPAAPPAPMPPATALAPAATLVANPETPAPAATRPFYKRWPFWTVVAGAIVAGVVIGVVVSSSSADGIPGQNTTYGSMTF